MTTTFFICFTIIICIWIICDYKYKRPKNPQQLTAQEACAHDMQPYVILYEDDTYKHMTSTCSKCGFEREYEFNKKDD
jgi:hypothetical protein